MRMMTEWKPGPTQKQNDCKSPGGSPKKIKIFEEIPKSDLSGSIASIACYPKTQFFFNTIQPLSLNSYFH